MLARTPGENIDIVSNMHMGVLIVSLVWFHFFQFFFCFFLGKYWNSVLHGSMCVSKPKGLRWWSIK